MAEMDIMPTGRCREHGVVMVITLLAIILIASLLFYVYNVGTSVEGRIVTQHAADATAIGGASQVARSMNTVAMNNVEIAKLIAVVNILDGIPLAVDMSVTDASEHEVGEVDAMVQAAKAQLDHGVADVWFANKLREMVDSNSTSSAVAEQKYLRDLDYLFRTQPNLIPEMTWYRAPSGKMGLIHQAIRSMDAQSQAVMESLDQTAQTAAISSARANLGNEKPDDVGLLLPAAPAIPWQRGAFADFERPVMYGLLPGSDERLSIEISRGLGQIDDELTNRGPWDAVFGWRTTDGIDADSGSVPPVYGNHWESPDLGTSTPGRAAETYEVIGLARFFLSIFAERRYSRLYDHLQYIQSLKSNYLWSSDDTTRIVPINPDWEIDVTADNERSQDFNHTYIRGIDSLETRPSMFIVVEIKSQVEDNEGLPQTQGVTWNYVDVPHRRSPRILVYNYWRDPDDGPLIKLDAGSIKGSPTWTRIQDYVWRLSAVYETNPDNANHGGDPEIGLEPKQDGTDSEGNPIYVAQEIYWEMDFLLVGVNVGEEIEVSNPWEGFDRDASDAPAPIDLIHEDLPPDDLNARLRYLTFLGMARQSNRPRFWPSRFDGDKAYPYNTAIAQAYVFNNHSWDLWTQTWQAQLEPVMHNRFSEYINMADDAAGIADQLQGLDPEQVQQMAEELRNVEPLMDVMLNH